MKNLITLTIALFTFCTTQASNSIAVESPDANLEVKIENREGQIFYSVYLNKKIFLKSFHR